MQSESRRGRWLVWREHAVDQYRQHLRRVAGRRPRDSAQVPAYESLEWDSNHFGYSVVRIIQPTLNEEELRCLLNHFRETGISLVYWGAEKDLPVSQQLLEEYSGAIVDHKTVFSADLRNLLSRPPAVISDSVEVAEYPEGSASDQLVALGLAAGVHSRFFRDSRISRGAASSLYTIWTERSARREIADVVFVARERATVDRLAGMVTCRLGCGVGSIGLIAVEESYRGKGVAGSLLAAAHHWMTDRGATHAEVVTQEENVAACRLYRARVFDPLGSGLLSHLA